MTKRMLIDATHPEETRVVIMDGNKIEDLDVETSIKKQIKSNIYLAKIIRVEPSLQAAFVDYGGNRHGFLAFNEIHPDYYQIPVADKEKIREEMMRIKAEEEERENSESAAEAKKADDSKENKEEQSIEQPETVTDVDYDELVRIKHNYGKNYKIQEIIHKGQILLVQVVKEERGNKGAALTTYLSLAGRYCVLMPNNVKGGGISKKITNSKDRQKLKKILNSLDIPMGMSVIVRTAGKERTKTEIKRDYDFLIKTWMKVRDLTVKSTAPCLVLEEGNIIKRSLRDNYTKDIEEIVIAGEAGYKSAKEYIKMLSPSHAKKLSLYKEKTPIFYHYQIENQLESIHSPYVQLKSGAYLVINQTEALVAIDVNSGRATKERSIEETALKANLEAAEEIARQLRLRDLAGLVVVDFIDMDEMKNNHALERKMKEVLKKDRARIQVGKISGFGLMEISRQRRHSSLLESNYHVCPYCRGRGLIRSSESAGIYILRVIEDEAIKGKVEEMNVFIPSDLALHILNKKRDELKALEEKYDVRVTISADDHLSSFLDYRLEKVKMRQTPQPVQDSVPYRAENENKSNNAPAVDNENGERNKNGKKHKKGRKNDASPAEGKNASSEGRENGENSEPTDGEAKNGERSGDTANGDNKGFDRKKRKNKNKRFKDRRKGQDNSGNVEIIEIKTDETATPPVAENGENVAPATEGKAKEGKAGRHEKRRGDRKHRGHNNRNENNKQPAPDAANDMPVNTNTGNDGEIAATAPAVETTATPKADNLPPAENNNENPVGEKANDEAAVKAESPKKRGWWQKAKEKLVG